MGELVDLNDEVSLSKERIELIKNKIRSIKEGMKEVCKVDPLEPFTAKDKYFIEMIAALIIRINEMDDCLDDLVEDSLELD